LTFLGSCLPEAKVDVPSTMELQFRLGVV